MDEGGTLDFEDLMDTGDEFPGFEIAKFTPANEADGNDDGVLRTPEHEKDDEDYIVNEKRNNHNNDDRCDKDNDSAEVAGDADIVASAADIEFAVNEQTNDNADDNLDKIENSMEHDVDMAETTEKGDNIPDIVLSDDDVKDTVENDVDMTEPTEKEDNEPDIVLSDDDDKDNVENDVDTTVPTGKGDNEPDIVLSDDDDKDNVENDVDRTEPTEKGDNEPDIVLSDDDDDKDNVENDVDTTEPTEKGDNEPDIVLSDDDDKDNVENDVNETGHADHQSAKSSDKAVEIVEMAEEKISTEDKVEDLDVEISEPAPKKKKMYLKPPQKRQSLMDSKKLKEKKSEDMVECVDLETGRDASDNENSKDAYDISENGEKEDGEEKDDNEIEIKNTDDEEEEPHQQSFLSFLNLKPGTSKPKKNEIEKEEILQKEFYSRKRLRTRKKVSYCEDVAQDDDDEYNVDDDDDEEYDDDHQIEQRRGSQQRNKSRRNSGTATYANALQNLLPGVDLSCLQRNQIKISSHVNNSEAVGAKGINMDTLKPQGNLKGLFECGLCGTFFGTASQFLTHQESVHAGEKKNGRSAMETFRCEVCGFVLTNRFAYLEHKKMKHTRGGAVTFSCSKCKVNKFPDIAALQKHQQVCGTPFCSTCGATFKAWVDVADHRKKVHAPSVPTRQWLNCANKTCSFKCVTQHEMRLHIQAKHMKNDMFTCNAPRCMRTFNTRELLTEHKKEAHASEFIVQYQCMECKNCFSSKTLLAEHQYLHTLEKLRKCDLCLRQFSNISDLRKHKDVHAVKGTIRCQSCFRWCVDKIELVNHVCAQKRRNIGIRLYFCDVCHKDFRSDEKMFIHRKEHKNFFQCDTCFSEFNSESEYFEHREKHGKFTCKECCEEMDEKDVEMHTKAHKYYIKLEEMENNGKNEKVMFLCPNLFNTIQA